ncbi:MAG: RNA 2'-phosphotransferase [Elusimicrobiota bacterium]|nr:RNA 2'-phosphotransferase [Elusimicrobiota bacterium]
MVDKVKLSKFMSYILRHNPKGFNLSIDRNGFVDIDELLEIIRKRYSSVSREMIEELIATSDKKRFEIVNNRIRATYGHTIPVELGLSEVEPPEILYHGTSRNSVVRILKEGLKPMSRQYVHLSVTEKDAFQVGLRRENKPAILKIKAREAFRSGIKFFKSGDVYLVKGISPEFIIWN